MKILFATTNPAKVEYYKEELEKRNIELLTIKDIEINLKVEENGKNAIENAYIKAKAYYNATKIITIGEDSNLFIEELPEDKQPGTHVRRVNGKRLTDEEMIEYYTNLATQYGGKLTAKWIFGMVIYDGKQVKEYTWSKNHFYIVDKPCKKRTLGYPLDSISILPETQKYFSEQTEFDKDSINEGYYTKKVIDFILQNIKEK